MIELNKIYNQDCLEGMKQIETGTIDLICTDAPYGLSFMGKNWDKATPSVEIWRECYRILKSGAFAFVMSSPRADVMCQMISRLQEAGFRTDFTPIFWTFAQGFPKSMNISKSVDKKFGVQQEIIGINGTVPIQTKGRRNSEASTEGKFERKENFVTKPTSPQAKALDGSYAGFQPKPAVEVIIVAMKPLSEATFVDQALTNGKGVTWLDKCRIPINPEVDASQLRTMSRSQKDEDDGWGMNNNQSDNPQVVRPDGRFPANLLVSDDCLNNGVLTKSPNSYTRGVEGVGSMDYGRKKGFGQEAGAFSLNYGDAGSFSRYFSLDAWWANQITKLPPQVQQTFPFIITPKANSGERNDGLDSLENECYLDDSRLDKDAIGCNNPRNRSGKTRSGNIHPTCKPVMLMAYLVTLGSRPNDVVVDPFLGSGTTAIACKILNRNYIGFEKEKAYYDIAVERTRFNVHQPLSQSIVENSAKFLTVENIEKAIQRHQKPNKIFGKYYA